MPLYVYQVINEDGSDGEVFEVLQGMSEPLLTQHPETGQPVKRVFGAPNAPRTWTDSHAKNATSDKNLERVGFTKYVKGEKGYKKLFGKGPDTMKRPPS